MIHLSDIRIGTKLLVMSGMSILLVAGMIASQTVGNMSIRAADERATSYQQSELKLVELKSALRGLQAAGLTMRLATTSAELEAALNQIGGRHGEVKGLIGQLTKRFETADDRQRGGKLDALADKYLASTKEIADAKKEGITIEERQLDALSRQKALDVKITTIARRELIPMGQEMDSLIEASLKEADAKLQRESTAAAEAMASIEQINYGIGGVIVLVLIGTAVFGRRSIARPLVGLIKPINDLSSGNFNVQIAGVDRKDEVGQIASAMNAMATRVRETIAEIKLSAMEVNSASGEISTSTTDLSQRTEEQAASLEETTAAMEEISATVKKSAGNAEEANRSATQARQVADQGGQVVAKAVNAMAKIEESSRKISDIIGVIDEIARQTNLLALNAAVEAARAGEAGRGFAVVASEVRSLAQRSSQAAKDIKELITNSNGQVQEGVDLVNKAGSALNEIVSSIKSVAELVADIAVASNEQATGLEQINRALMQMDEATQQNAALVEENAATAKALETQAQSMDERVAFFKIEEGSAPAPQRAAAVPETAPAKPAPAKAEISAVEASAGAQVGDRPARPGRAHADGFGDGLRRRSGVERLLTDRTALVRPRLSGRGRFLLGASAALRGTGDGRPMLCIVIIG